MIIFNTTYHVEEEVLSEFMAFLTDEFVPTAITTHELKHPRLTRVLSHIEEEQKGTSLALQFEVTDVNKLDEWYDAIGTSLNEAMVARFGNRIVGFSTLLEVIDL